MKIGGIRFSGSSS